MHHTNPLLQQPFDPQQTPWQPSPGRISTPTTGAMNLATSALPLGPASWATRSLPSSPRRYRRRHAAACHRAGQGLFRQRCRRQRDFSQENRPALRRYPQSLPDRPGITVRLGQAPAPGAAYLRFTDQVCREAPREQGAGALPQRR